MTENNEQLKPCPFCGSSDVELGYIRNEIYPLNTYLVCCKGCDTTVGDSYSAARAAADWNRRVENVSKWVTEVPSEPGMYWVLQEGYDTELSSFYHPPLVKLSRVPTDGDRPSFWQVQLLAGAFFHPHHGAMFSIWYKEPTLEWVLHNYNIQYWKRVEYPVLPQKEEKNDE